MQRNLFNDEKKTMPKYKLVNGDCFDVMGDMPDESVDAIITDPPYGAIKHKIETDIDIQRFFLECKRLIKPNGFMAFFGQQPTLSYWNVEAFKHFTYKNEVVWYKRQGGSPMLDMMRLFENITVVCKGKRKFNDVRLDYVDLNFSLAEFLEKSSFDRKHSVIKQFLNDREKLLGLIDSLNGNPTYSQIQSDNNQKSSMQTSPKKENAYYPIGKLILEGYKPRNLISFRSHNRQKLDSSKNGGGSHNVKHPTVKPIQLMEYLIKLTTNENDIILDPFVGSGTTILAGMNTNRTVIGVEKFPQYHLITQQRINDWIN
jgi:DNA modification methylase